MQEYTCPVCGYGGLLYPPENYTICPCCYTEFGYTDFNASHAELRRRWAAAGYPWMSERVTSAPSGWDPIEQLKQAGF